MGQKCCICIHDKRIEIEKEILQGLPHSKIALKYDVGMMSVRRHAQNHLSRQLVKHKETRELLHSDSLLQELNSLVDRTKAILDDSEDNKKHVISLRAIAELRNTYELFVKLALTMKEVIGKDEEKAKRKQIDDLGNLSDKELTLLGELLRKAENGGGGKEILGLDWKIALREDDIYLYQRVMETIKDDKEARERVARGEVLYYEEEERKRKLKIRKRVQKDFEDEEKETDETTDGDGED